MGQIKKLSHLDDIGEILPEYLIGIAQVNGNLKRTTVADLLLVASGAIQAELSEEEPAVEIPAGYMVTEILISPSEEMTIKIGTTDGGDEIMPEDTIDDDKVISTIGLVCRSAKTIYFSGITASAPIIIYTKPLNNIS